MALNPQSLLHQLSPARGLDLSGMFGSPGQSMAREQLRLAREQFEFQKKKAEEEKDLEELKLGAMKEQRAALAEKERLDREAAAQATLLGKQQEGVMKFGELAGSGKVEQAQAMVPYLDQLGYSVTDLGGVGGLPVFELQNRAQEAARANAEFESAPRGIDTWDGGESATGSLARMSGMGLPENTRGQLDEPAGIGSTEDAFSRAQAASGFAEATGKPLRGPDEEDYTGAVPRNVIDLPAQQAATLARLKPMLGAIQESYPTDYRGSAEKTGEAVMGSGLPAIEALALFKDLRGSPDELIKAQLNADAQKEQFREKRDQFTPMDIEKFKQTGWGEAESLATKNKIPDAATGYALGDTVLDLLEDDTGANDTMIAGALMDMQAIKGIPSDRDMEMAFGTGKQSFIDQVFGYVESAAKGGFSTVQRQALKSFVQRTQKDLKSRVYNYLDNADAPGTSYNEHVKAGFRDRARQFVNDAGLLGEYEEDRQKSSRGKKSAAAPGKQFDPNPISGDFDIELEGLALENDLDPDKIAPLIRHESGGKAGAVSSAGASGVMQIMPDNLRKMGIEPEAFRKLSATEQLPYVIEFFQKNGITSESSADDYALAVAASDPKWRSAPDSAVIYPKGSKAWEQNKPWRPADGGDITKESILRFYGLRGKEGANQYGDNPDAQKALEILGRL